MTSETESKLLELLDLLAQDIFTDAPEYAERVARAKALLCELSQELTEDR